MSPWSLQLLVGKVRHTAPLVLVNKKAQTISRCQIETWETKRSNNIITLFLQAKPSVGVLLHRVFTCVSQSARVRGCPLTPVAKHMANGHINTDPAAQQHDHPIQVRSVCRTPSRYLAQEAVMTFGTVYRTLCCVRPSRTMPPLDEVMKRNRLTQDLEPFAYTRVDYSPRRGYEVRLTLHLSKTSVTSCGMTTADD